ncbi:hypothetical protein [Corynebacterium variabile]|uniref:hypothetical protein n=1 Tax=Corynebacterium variabile TaxID=1727 RepID=UPI0026476E97|nr:hypothetical protein [Corynebacterium variabile]MDN6241626.1 hypothetical protein [Corynebacterium variabile]MDN6478939.1 hypothetical protein [Corynebacterium variabile]MDN6676403.1 hypothetical protein [Corynebacterium variabile]MDN6844131.1 hypothetical protein [Corynebacterium variabile]
MKSRLSSLIGAAILTGALAAGCTSDDSGDAGESTTTTPTTTTTSAASTSSSAVDEPDPTDALDNPVESEVEEELYTPAPVPEVQDVPASAPAYGVPCSAAQVGMPATGADGTSLVCVGMGANAPATWVYGPEPAGVGTASDGGGCTEGEAGGQDNSGHMMMCVGGQWVYGP